MSRKYLLVISIENNVYSVINENQVCFKKKRVRLNVGKEIEAKITRFGQAIRTKIIHIGTKIECKNKLEK